jgi:hypothetical protein
MKTHINYQTKDYQGNPAFVLVPWDDFKRIRPGDKGRKQIKREGGHRS